MARFTQLVQPAHQPEEPRRRPIDLVYLAKNTSGNTVLELDVLRMFDQVSRTYVSRIEATSNIGEIARALHSLKGAATSVGAWSIVELATTMEGELAEGATVDAERIGDLDWAVHETSEFIGEMLKVGLI